MRSKKEKRQKAPQENPIGNHKNNVKNEQADAKHGPQKEHVDNAVCFKAFPEETKANGKKYVWIANIIKPKLLIYLLFVSLFSSIVLAYWQVPCSYEYLKVKNQDREIDTEDDGFTDDSRAHETTLANSDELKILYIPSWDPRFFEHNPPKINWEIRLQRSTLLFFFLLFGFLLIAIAVRSILVGMKSDLETALDPKCALRIVYLTLFVIMTFFVFLLIRMYFPDDSYQIDLSEGTISVKGKNNERQIYVAHQAASGWQQTGVYVQSGERILFSATGNTNTGVHRIVEAGNYDTHPKHPWSLRTILKEVDRSSNRRRSKMKENTEEAALLAYICCFGETCPDISKPNTISDLKSKHKDDIEVVARPGQPNRPWTMTARCDGEIYLAINDNYPVMRKDYIYGKDERTKKVRRFLLESRRFPVKQIALTDWIYEAKHYEKICLSTFNLDFSNLDKDCRGSMDYIYKEKDSDLSAKNGDDEMPECGLLSECANRIINCEKFPTDSDCSGISEIDISDADQVSYTETELRRLLYIQNFMRWELVVKKYPGLWFDENVGLYLVTMRIKPS